MFKPQKLEGIIKQSFSLSNSSVFHFHIVSELLWDITHCAFYQWHQEEERTSPCHILSEMSIISPEGCTSTEDTKEVGILWQWDPKKPSPDRASTCALTREFLERLPYVQALEIFLLLVLSDENLSLVGFPFSIYLNPSIDWCFLPPELYFKKVSRFSCKVHCSGEKFSNFLVTSPTVSSIWDHNLITFIPMNWYFGVENPLIHSKRAWIKCFWFYNYGYQCLKPSD